MTATNMFSNFGGFRCSPPKLVDAIFHDASFCLKMCGESYLQMYTDQNSIRADVIRDYWQKKFLA